MFKQFIKVLFLLFFLLSGCKNGKASVDHTAENDDDSAVIKEDTDNNNDSDPDDDKTDLNNDPDLIENDQNMSDEDNFYVEICDSIEVVKGGNESCPYPSTEKQYIRFAGGGANFDSSLLRSTDGLRFVIDEIEIRDETYETSIVSGRKSVFLKGKCIGEQGQNGENACTASFEGYDESLFKKEVLIGKEWVLFYVLGFYGDVNGDVLTRHIFIIKEKDGNLVSLAGAAIVNEDGEKNWDVKVWPSSLVPEITAEPVSDVSNCAAITCGFSSSGNGTAEIKIAPPIKFSRTGKEIIVKNGEVIEKDGYVYNVRGSMMAHPKDGDQMLSDTGKKYRFDFFILNTEALK